MIYDIEFEMSINKIPSGKLRATTGLYLMQYLTIGNTIVLVRSAGESVPHLLQKMRISSRLASGVYSIFSLI
jgi:hypothetical protein